MEAARWDQLERIFERACTLSPDQRGSYVDGVCGEDEALREELRSLLACAEAAPAFFESLAGAVPTPELPEAPRPDPAGDPYRLIGQTVSRYRVEALLGGGGMGVVYRAVDGRLRRTVALKFLPPQWQGDAEAKQRFIREAQAASALDHPNIAGVYEVDETEEGQLYIAMRCYEGETLEPKLDRGPLSLDEALDYAAQVARGLAAAHAQGIVHRDIKPANIIITGEGVVKLVDFGLAKLAGGTQLTKVGVTMGTVAYMSPEQARGEAIDHRTDLWSLGVVLYEMLTGERPFRGEYEQAVLYSILHEEPEPLTARRPDTPPALEAVVERCLRKDPDDRYPSAAALLEDLERLRQDEPVAAPSRPKQRWVRLLRPRILASVGASLLLLAFLLAWALPESRQRMQPLFKAAPPIGMHLAVLPFEHLGGDEQDRLPYDGLVQTLPGLLAQISEFGGAPVTIATASETAGISSFEAARRQLGAQGVFTGRIVHREEEVQLVLDFVQAGTKASKTKTLIVPRGNMAALQEEMVTALAQMLGVALSPEAEYVLSTLGTRDAEAYEHYLEGRAHLHDISKSEDIDVAIRFFEWALEEDSSFVLAYAGLCTAYWSKYEATQRTEYVPLAEHHCGRASRSEEHLPSVLVELGRFYLVTGAYEQALQEYKAALALDTTSAAAHRGLALSYKGQGRYQEAERHFHSAISLRPEFWANYNNLGELYLDRADYRAAAEQFRHVIELNPDNLWGYNNIGAAYLYLGFLENSPEMFGKAREMFEHAVALKPNDFAYSNLGIIAYAEERYEEEARMYEKALAIDSSDFRIWGNLGGAYTRISQEQEKSKAAFERAARLAEARLGVNPNNIEVLSLLADYYVQLEHPAKARPLLERALTIAPKDVNLLVAAARVFETIGEREKALQLLGEAVEGGYPIEMIEQEPAFAQLRDDPRFERSITRSSN